MIWKYLQQTDKPIFLYGMGNGAESIIKQLNKVGKEPTGFFASDDFVRGQEFLGKRVMKYSEAKSMYPDMIALISFGTQREEVIQNILSLDCEKYVPEVPVIGEQVFDEEFYHANEKKMNEVCAMLADERSKEVYNDLIHYRLTGKIEYLLSSESKREEIYSILQLNDENYLDLGAYNGDTANEFKKYCKKITAVEPDKKTFAKLERNAPFAKNINAAVGETVGKVMFASMGGRNSRKGGNTEIDQITIDSLNEDFTFIKMDVEGEEKSTILGGTNTLKKKPKLLISAYHRSEDLFEIPLLIKSINPKYKIYIRRPRYFPPWDTEFCFI